MALQLEICSLPIRLIDEVHKDLALVGRCLDQVSQQSLPVVDPGCLISKAFIGRHALILEAVAVEVQVDIEALQRLIIELIKKPASCLGGAQVQGLLVEAAKMCKQLQDARS